MNKIEKAIYDVAKHSPAIKYFLRNTYQGIFDLLPRPDNYFLNTPSAKEDCFFGFHDCTPFSADNSKVLCHRTHIPVRMPLKGETLEVGYVDMDKQGELGDFHCLATSNAWNYHKGCRLQWRGEYIVFNDACDGVPCSRAVSLDGEEVAHWDWALDTVSSDGQLATSFSYRRLQELMPGYGYEHITDDNAFLEQCAPAETGLFIIDLQNNRRQLLMSLKELASEVSCDKTEHHYVTHSEFSQDGSCVSFLHRWVGNDTRKRNTRLVVYNLKDGSHKALPTTGMVSHYVWTPRHEIVAYCSVKEGDAHVLFDISHNTYRPVCLGRINMDGHQSMAGEKMFVSDTYPDRRRMATLNMIEISKDSYQKIAYVYSPKKFQTRDFHKHIACDLHPRMSADGRFVCFDTVFTGSRSLCVMPLQ